MPDLLRVGSRRAGALGLSLVLLAACGDDGGVDAGPRDAGEGVDAGEPSLDGGPDGGQDAGPGVPPTPLAPLPPIANATTDHFLTHDRCADCHRAEAGATLRDASGRDISMVSLWRTSMMSFAARDPFYLAAFAHEIEENPGARDGIEATCTRCHAAAGSVELGLTGGHVSFDALTTSTDPVATVSREGVTCTVCHQIRDEGLGTDASFTGGFTIGTSREIFGPHDAPFGMPMVMSTGFTPVASSHVRESELCATCHTVITRALDETGTPVGPEFTEQVPYLEWRNSDYASGGASQASCQSCHVPTTDEDGVAISTPISTRPGFLGARSPVGRHVFRGANAYMLSLIANNTAWVGTDVPAATLMAASADTAANLRTAATVSVVRLATEGEVLVAEIRVENHSGHRFPTAYPTRRAWLRVAGLDAAGAERWVSGRFDARGALVDANGTRLDTLFASLPHRQVVAAEDEVQVWHTEMLDVSGAPTSVLLSAASYSLDNRILPLGWSAAHPDAARTSPVGTEGDADFVPGSDTVTYRIPVSSGATRVRAELLFQTVPPAAVEALADHPTPAYARLTQMVDATPATPTVVASDER